MTMSSDEDDFVFYGNALDPIDEDSIPRKKPIIIEDQYAKDDRGRRRFHGAFTGGFSAGFYNSVGSSEGWQPTNFKSSRTNRTHSKDQSIFDFMDDEDTGEHGICPISLQVRPTFDRSSSSNIASSNKMRNKIVAEDEYRACKTNAVFIQEMLAPVRDTIGVKLLMKMGWRPGQGVGPRMSVKEKKLRERERRDAKKVYGCSLPNVGNDSSDNSDGDTECDIDLDDITFAPDDYQAYIVRPKQNSFGLGYQGIDRKPVLSSKPAELSVLTVAGKSIRGQAFGVSVFEEEDDDIYSTEDMSNYDFSLPHANEAKQIHTKQLSPKNTNCIDGFHLARAVREAEPPFALPVIPSDFQPLKLKKTRWDCAAVSANNMSSKATKVSSAAHRSLILQTDEERSRSVDACARICDIPLPEKAAASFVSSTNSCMVFKPFAYDIEKQNRYEQFLTLKDSSSTHLKTGRVTCVSIYPSNMTEWEKERERNEFEQAARLYRPLAEDLGSRFTQASQQENVHDILTPVTRVHDAELETLRNAAKNRMFGILTRTKHDWRPDKVICKRFNIPEPFDSTSCSVAEESSKQSRRSGSSLFEFLKMSTGTSERDSVNISQTQPASSPPLPSTHRNEYKQTDASDETVEGEQITHRVTDKVDLFKAIFLNSSDEEEADEPNEISQNVAKSDSSSPLPSQSRDSGKVIRYSPARGIFANLDLESLKCTSSLKENMNLLIDDDKRMVIANESTFKQSESAGETLVDESLLYGPPIPSSLAYANPSKCALENAAALTERETSTRSHSASFVWVEKSSSKKREKRKHKKNKKQQKRSKKKR